MTTDEVWTLLGDPEGRTRFIAALQLWDTTPATPAEMVAELLAIRDDTDADRETMFTIVAQMFGVNYDALMDAWLGAPKHPEFNSFINCVEDIEAELNEIDQMDDRDPQMFARTMGTVSHIRRVAPDLALLREDRRLDALYDRLEAAHRKTFKILMPDVHPPSLAEWIAQTAQHIAGAEANKETS